MARAHMRTFKKYLSWLGKLMLVGSLLITMFITGSGGLTRAFWVLSTPWVLTYYILSLGLFFAGVLLC
jgi:hypothetical protein